ncbi:hypothetical protein [Echinimonas agarilytica]|uniref:DUF3379 domain-containing protein n=1 Tax=Echinimonas agarilytica TaxID=1215918 RepID=A0AA42B7D7_9GAMM|nr:hypothetical protein [Echinimonas agarilytica]MCM2679148.1 hypothetical protein [Echinimonas agarilytica]
MNTIKQSPSGNAKIIQEIVESYQIDSGVLNDLLAKQNDILQDKPAPRASFKWVGPIIAAFIMMSLFAGLTHQLSSANYSLSIAKEVAKNHVRLKPLDVATGNMNDLRKFFTLLDFSPTESSLLKQDNVIPDSDLIGGRYCSIRGETAAQLRYQQDNQTVRTLYEVEYDEKIFGTIPMVENGEIPMQYIIDGLSITIWVEQELMMALVQPL